MLSDIYSVADFNAWHYVVQYLVSILALAEVNSTIV